ncbi:response regulator [Teichococcus cervicalis]|uniref:histidine kinase n=1 Tax=Pseudoroseomonas cervicalis ATCC 49957 TaxID=525371 RepID=D5RGU8_9PROT|nr:response regulator [Pseudoroseomonas cervicalis]EFH13460.1 ATPase/histidine kinase/DNA gyrase B/HSP90 domain protein [Pseudoroseomonas cervicalis ATCC 49957]
MHAAGERAAPQGAAETLLLVEDSDTQALQMRRLLEAEGFAVTRAATAELALEALNQALPALVIVDYHLPGMNGDELARQIRLNSRSRALPVLMLTEAREGDVERQGLESGADAYVPKSADQALLLLRIRALLRRRAAGATPGQGGVFRRARMLVVDDGATYRTYLAGLLTREGYAVESAASAEAALEAVAASPAEWDCVVMNAFSAGFDGVLLCARLNALRAAALGDGGGPGFQIVALGPESTAGREMLTGLFEAGADELVPATAEARVLSLRIRAALRRKLLQEEDRRSAAELREREMSVQRAQAEAAAAQAKAALAEALARANDELADTNRQLKDTQTKLVQAAKMASLGELVAGIAHEINNPLAFILAHQGTVERLLGQIQPMLAEDAAARPLVERCRDRSRSMTLGLKRIQDLVLNLRKFSRQDDAFQRVNVPDALDTVLALLAHKLGERIEVRRDYRAAPELRCSPALLNQVVMNIVANAADAIAERGHISIATESDGQTYRIAISDSGPGVPEGLRERIFEPFFTTKPVGAGTGLGLAIAYNVIQAHDGTISVGTGPEGGASFVISVPMQQGR